MKGRLAIIGCVLMEDEIVYLLSHDDAVSEIVIVENEDSSGVTSKLRERLPHSMVRTIRKEELDTLVYPDGLSVLIWMKPMALHESPELLKEEVRETLKTVDNLCDSVLLFYGLCGNAFRNIEAISGEVKTPVSILRDHRDEVVDDCIGAVVGGTEEYLNLLKRYPGVMYMTPMWASNWRKLIVKTGIAPDVDDLETLRMIFQMVGYKKVLKIDTGLGDRDRFDREVDDFARSFEFEKEEMNGCTLSVIESSWKKAKDLLT